MKRVRRLISALCVFAICLCCTPLLASAATPNNTIQPNAQVPYPDMGDGLPVEYLFTMEAAHVEEVLFSNGSYLGRTLLSGTERFGYIFTMTHSLAAVAPNYAFRAGICYYNQYTDLYELFDYEQPVVSGKTYVRYIDKYEFDPNFRYYGFVRNLMSDGYISGSLHFFRDPI